MRLLHSRCLDTEHLLLALLKDNDNIVCKILNNNDVTYEAVHKLLAMKPDVNAGFDFGDDEEEEEPEEAPSEEEKKQPKDHEED